MYVLGNQVQMHIKIIGLISQIIKVLQGFLKDADFKWNSARTTRSCNLWTTVYIENKLLL